MSSGRFDLAVELFFFLGALELFKVLRLNTPRDSADVQGKWSIWDHFYAHINTRRPKESKNGNISSYWPNHEVSGICLKKTRPP